MAKQRLFIVMILLLSLTTPCFSGGNEIFKYTLYIGLNDKDTYQQEIGTIEAEEIITEIILGHTDGFTRVVAKGAYKDDQGVITFENSLIYEFLNTSEELIYLIMDEILVALNQNSILLETTKVDSKFYEGVRP